MAIADCLRMSAAHVPHPAIGRALPAQKEPSAYNKPPHVAINRKTLSSHHIHHALKDLLAHGYKEGVPGYEHMEMNPCFHYARSCIDHSPADVKLPDSRGPICGIDLWCIYLLYVELLQPGDVLRLYKKAAHHVMTTRYQLYARDDYQLLPALKFAQHSIARYLQDHHDAVSKPNDNDDIHRMHSGATTGAILQNMIDVFQTWHLKIESALSALERVERKAMFQDIMAELKKSDCTVEERDVILPIGKQSVSNFLQAGDLVVLWTSAKRLSMGAHPRRCPRSLALILQ